MENITWKSFRLDNLFTFDSGNQLLLNKKALDVSDDKNGEYTVALITQSEKNNGISGYLAENDEISSKKMKRYLTYSMHFDLCFYHNYDFVLMDTHGSVFRLLANNTNFKKILDVEDSVNYFISMIITHVCSNDIYNYSWLPNSSRVGRELILLPCLEVGKGEEYIWEESGKHYTLAVEYIKKMMNEAKELHEQKTIRLYEAERAKYEAERAKYEAERAKYEAGYKRERDSLVWKKFKLGELFDRSTKLALGANQKDLNLVEQPDSEHSIALISASRSGSGRVGYVEDDLVNKNIISINKLTFDDQWGFTFFQQEPFVITGGHNAILEIKDENLKKHLDCNLFTYSFLSLLINKITVKSDIFGYGYKINNKLDRELILLPCLEVGEGEEYIWEESGKHYTLAVEYISYVYLTGRVNYNQKRIDNYTYQY